MKKKEEKIRMTVDLDPAIADRLTSLSNELGISVGEAIGHIYEIMEAKCNEEP